VKAALLALTLLAPVLLARAEGPFYQYLRHSAESGDAESQFILGVAYRDGWEGDLKPGTVAAKWRELAAELDDHRPVLVLGLLRQEQVRIHRDERSALQLLNQAAAMGENYARVILADMLLEGDGVPADWRHGAELIRTSAAEGFPPAQYRLGLLYLVGGEGTPKDEVEALAWFIIAADAGLRNAVEFRDERTQMLGREIARLAIKRSRTLLGKDQATASDRHF
jgi:hypothetical protein